MLTFGPKVQLTEFDENIFQGGDKICAIRCQEMILRDYGIIIPKDELTAYATAQGWYSGTGTKLKNIGNLLETCNIKTHSLRCESPYDLINELKDGHRVIVGVDANELRAEEGSEEYEFYRNLPNANHALIVTSVSIDTEHPEKSTVVLTDPGNGAIMEYDFEKFARSWSDSKYFMMATDEPAPYQYNAHSKCMEVSNFATDESMREFPFHNEFTDIWEVDRLGYVPYYEDGHLLSLTENMSYDDFISAYDNDRFDMLDDTLNVCDNHGILEQVEFHEEGFSTVGEHEDYGIDVTSDEIPFGINIIDD